MESILLATTSALRGEFSLPASKSISNRALLVRALCPGCPMPQNVSDCDDTRAMTAALSRMPEVIDIGAAGTAMRFLTAYLSVTPGSHVITGTERMRHRPIGILVDALRQMGADIAYEGEEGFPPLRITGRTGLQGGAVALPGNVSSQYVSALLMIAPTLQQGLTLTLTGDIVSRPYLDMTLTLMRDFGAEAHWQGMDTIAVGPVAYRPIPYYIENDWSAASYWYEMVALSGDTEAEVVLPGLQEESMQGDAHVRDIFALLGVGTQFFTAVDGTRCIRLRKCGEAVKHLDFDFVRQPDLAQTVVVTCAMLGVTFRFTGLQSLKIKETDRMAALQNELGKLGVEVEQESDSVLSWDGRRHVVDAVPVIATYEDHRMAMAFAPACMRVGQMVVEKPLVVGKSYPTYWENLRKAGFRICEM